jgi:hypothetical protein
MQGRQIRPFGNVVRHVVAGHHVAVGSRHDFLHALLKCRTDPYQFLPVDADLLEKRIDLALSLLVQPRVAAADPFWRLQQIAQRHSLLAHRPAHREPVFLANEIAQAAARILKGVTKLLCSRVMSFALALLIVIQRPVGQLCIRR